MSIQVIFDKVQGYPLLPEDVSFSYEGVISIPVSNGDFIETVNIQRKTVQVNLKGASTALVDPLRAQADAYNLSLLSGNPSGTTFTVNGEDFIIKSVTTGSPVNVNGNVVYIQATLVGINRDLVAT